MRQDSLQTKAPQGAIHPLLSESVRLELEIERRTCVVSAATLRSVITNHHSTAGASRAPLRRPLNSPLRVSTRMCGAAARSYRPAHDPHASPGAPHGHSSRAPRAGCRSKLPARGDPTCTRKRPALLAWRRTAPQRGRHMVKLGTGRGACLRATTRQDRTRKASVAVVVVGAKGSDDGRAAPRV